MNKDALKILEIVKKNLGYIVNFRTEKDFKIRLSVKELLKKMPECYLPLPPFFDFCNNRNLKKKKCLKCFKKNKLKDFIE